MGIKEALIESEIYTLIPIMAVLWLLYYCIRKNKKH